MEKAAELAIIILSLYYIGLPLLRRRVFEAGIPAETAERRGYHQLLMAKENAYATIKDIRFDYKAGKISEEDYAELIARYEREAMGILKKIDACKKNLQKKAGQQKKRAS